MNAETLPEPAAAYADEVEVWWGAYSIRALAPMLAATFAVSVGLIFALALLAHLGLRPSAARWAGYALVGGLWLVQMLRCGYRTIGYSYRLTTRRLFLQHGFSSSPAPSIELASVTVVRVLQTPAERWLGVGRVIVEGREGATSLVLEGVYQPEQTALTIRGKK
jgi:hypothetical protein